MAGLIVPYTSHEAIQVAGAPGAHYRPLSEFEGNGDQMGQALQNFGRAVGDFGDKHFKIALEHQKTIQALDLEEDIQNFRRESQKWQDDYRQGRKGRDAMGAEMAYTEWNAQRAQELKEKWEGHDEALAYLHHYAGQEALSGQNAMRDYEASEAEAWKGSVFNSEDYFLMRGIEEDPGSYRQRIGDSVRLIRAANPGRDTRAMEAQWAEKAAMAAIEAMMGQGDTEGARKTLDREAGRLDPEAAARLRKGFDEAQEQATTSSLTRQGIAMSQGGAAMEFKANLDAMLEQGKISPEVHSDILKGVEGDLGHGNKLLEEARKARQAEAEAQAEQMIQEGKDPWEYVSQNPDIPYAKKVLLQRDWSHGVSMDNPGGRELDQRIRQGIECGDIVDAVMLRNIIKAGDPNKNLVGYKQAQEYEKLLEEAGGGKPNYYKDAMDYMFKEEFSGDPEKWARFQEQVRLKMAGHHISAFDPTAADLVKEMESGGWWKESPAERDNPARNFDKFMEKAKGSHGPGPAPQMDLSDATAQKWTAYFGLPDNPACRALTMEALSQGKNPFDVTASYMLEWPGQGRMSLRTLGNVGQWRRDIEYYSRVNGLDPDLVATVMYVESGGDPRATSKAGARGLMQLMPGTARDLGVADAYDPEENIRGACEYLSRLVSRYHGDWEKAVMAYNAGPGRIDPEDVEMVPKETWAYVEKIRRIYGGHREGRTGGAG